MRRPLLATVSLAALVLVSGCGNDEERSDHPWPELHGYDEQDVLAGQAVEALVSGAAFAGSDGYQIVGVETYGLADEIERDRARADIESLPSWEHVAGDDDESWTGFEWEDQRLVLVIAFDGTAPGLAALVYSERGD